MSAFIRLVAHTPELQAYTASKLYLALKADLSQESLTLAATWILGEYSEVILQGGIIDDDQNVVVSYFTMVSTMIMLWQQLPICQIADEDLVNLISSVMDSPYANYLIRQFVLAAITKIAARNTTSSAEQDRIAEMLAKYTTSPELELQQRAVEFASLFTLGEMRVGVLEQMPPPELKATVMGVGE